LQRVGPLFKQTNHLKTERKWRVSPPLFGP